MSLNGIVFPSMVFTTGRQADQKNNCLGYESLVPKRQSPAFNSLDLGIPVLISSIYLYLIHFEVN